MGVYSGQYSGQYRGWCLQWPGCAINRPTRRGLQYLQPLNLPYARNCTAILGASGRRQLRCYFGIFPSPFSTRYSECTYNKQRTANKTCFVHHCSGDQIRNIRRVVQSFTARHSKTMLGQKKKKGAKIAVQCRRGSDRISSPDQRLLCPES